MLTPIKLALGKEPTLKTATIVIIVTIAAKFVKTTLATVSTADTNLTKS